MACGVPVVASDISDNAFIVAHGRTGFIVPVNDPAAAAARVGSLLETGDVRRRFGIAATACVREGFSLHRAARDLERIYGQRLARRRGV